jgi:hypothetical protein
MLLTGAALALMLLSAMGYTEARAVKTTMALTPGSFLI